MYDKIGLAEQQENEGLSINGSGLIGYQPRKKNLDLYLISYTKFNSRWTIELNIKGKIKLEDKIGEYIHGFWLGKCLLNRLQKKLTLKENSDKLVCIKVKNFHSSEDTIKRVKKEKSQIGSFIAHVSDKGIISNICRELPQINKKKTQYENKQEILTGTSQKRMSKQPINICKLFNLISLKGNAK